MKIQTCCFTGHRDIEKKERQTIKKRLAHEVKALIKQGVTCFIAGGALGFDTMAALAVLKQRRKTPHIKLLLALPCKDQTKYWNNRDVRVYKHIIKQADKVTYVSEQYYSGCMYKRNRYLVENSQFCICYLTKSNGGTAYTVNYAKRKGLKIINLANTTFVSGKNN